MLQKLTWGTKDEGEQPSFGIRDLPSKLADPAYRTVPSQHGEQRAAMKRAALFECKLGVLQPSRWCRSQLRSVWRSRCAEHGARCLSSAHPPQLTVAVPSAEGNTGAFVRARWHSRCWSPAQPVTSTHVWHQSAGQHRRVAAGATHADFGRDAESSQDSKALDSRRARTACQLSLPGQERSDFAADGWLSFHDSLRRHPADIGSATRKRRLCVIIRQVLTVHF